MIFKKQYHLLSELDKLENLMPKHKDLLRKVSLFIRNKLWDKSDEKRLAHTLNVMNMVYTALIDISGEFSEIIDSYVKVLENCQKSYSRYNLFRDFLDFKANFQILIVQERMKEHWLQINPYFRNDFAHDELYEKNLLHILDDLFRNAIDVYPDKFYIKLENIKDSCRCREGKRTEQKELLPPPVGVAKKLNINNRWNPPDKAYLYLSYNEPDIPFNDNYSLSEYTCLMEKRAKLDVEYTISRFQISKSAQNKSVINLSFQDTNREDILKEPEQPLHEYAEQISSLILANKTPSQKEINALSDSQHSEIKILSAILCGKLLLKEMCDAIFVPLTDEEDNDDELKDKCYKSFHVLAEFIEKKGIAGIIHPSPRMRLLNKSSNNLVLFNVDDAFPIVESYKPITF